jgi:hypothetical protein
MSIPYTRGNRLAHRALLRRNTDAEEITTEDDTQAHQDA